MKRVSENRLLIDRLFKEATDKPEGTYQEMLVFQLSAISDFLTDISKSLALIADSRTNVRPEKSDYISIDNAMAVFDDFMCGEVDEDGMNTFLEMLKDTAESEENHADHK